MENGLLRRVALGIFYLTLIGAPLFGGIPPGAVYGSDTLLNALRCLALVSGLLLTLLPDPDEGSRQKVPFLPRLAPMLMLVTVGWTVLSLLVHSRFLTSPVLLFALVPGTLDWIVYGVAFMVALRLAQEAWTRQATLVAILTGATLAASLSVWEAIYATTPGQRAQGAFFSPNFAAGLFALCLPVAASRCLAEKDKRAAWGLGAASALMAGALVASGSRAGIALAALGLLVALGLVTFSGRVRGLPWGRVALLALSLITCGFLLRGAITSRASAGVQEQSGDFRKWTWQGTANMARANPLFGTGPGTYPYVYPRYALVEKTDLAHSSYLQIAAEQGFPTLLTALGVVVAALGSGIAALWKARRTASDDAVTFLICGLAGGLLAALGRSVFDSEWSLLGNGIPFWSLAGLLVGLASPLAAAARGAKSGSRISLMRIAAGAGLAVSFVLALLCLKAVQAREAAQAAARIRINPPTLSEDFGWPPDPDLAPLQGRSDLAAQWEPSGKRFYQLGRLQVAQSDAAKAQGDMAASSEAMGRAVESLRRATVADPNNLQAWNRLAETLGKMKRTDESLAAYRELIRRYEGPAGQVRAIPELTETYPAFAYFALGKADDAAGNVKDALNRYENATQVIERYSRTSPTYQQVEVASAMRSGVDLAERRGMLVTLYGSITEARLKREPARRAEFDARRAETAALLTALPTQFPQEISAPMDVSATTP